MNDDVDLQAMQALLDLGFAVSVLPALSIPHPTSQRFRTDLCECRDMNLAVRAASVFGLVVNAEAWQATVDESEVYRKLVALQPDTFEVRIGARQAVLAFKLDWRTVLVGDGLVRDQGRLHGANIERVILAHGAVFENGKVVPVVNNRLAVAEVGPELREILVTAGAVA